ncbi:MAG: hypothetical protein WC527_04385 [Candidatus Margulisiibacteriota bacterium]
MSNSILTGTVNSQNIIQNDSDDKYGRDAIINNDNRPVRNTAKINPPIILASDQDEIRTIRAYLDSMIRCHTINAVTLSRIQEVIGKWEAAIDRSALPSIYDVAPALQLLDLAYSLKLSQSNFKDKASIDDCFWFEQAVDREEKILVNPQTRNSIDGINGKFKQYDWINGFYFSKDDDILRKMVCLNIIYPDTISVIVQTMTKMLEDLTPLVGKSPRWEGRSIYDPQTDRIKELDIDPHWNDRIEKIVKTIKEQTNTIEQCEQKLSAEQRNAIWSGREREKAQLDEEIKTLHKKLETAENAIESTKTASKNKPVIKEKPSDGK